MTAFELGQAVEQRGLEALAPFLRLVAWRGQFVTTLKGPLSRMLQDTVGDVLLNTRNGQVWSVEIKTEQSNDYGNFFLETWSNKNYAPRKLGWVYTNMADVFWYYFIEQDELYSINNRRLFEWAHEARSLYVKGGRGRLYDYPEKTQQRYEQLNRTWGRCVPIADIQREVGFRLYHPLTEGVDAAPLSADAQQG